MGFIFTFTANLLSLLCIYSLLCTFLQITNFFFVYFCLIVFHAVILFASLAADFIYYLLGPNDKIDIDCSDETSALILV